MNFKITLFLVFITCFGFGQSEKVRNENRLVITGKVLDEDLVPLMGVIVHEKNTQNFTTTSFNGAYSIEASVGAVLNFSIIGFDTIEIAITDQKIVDVILPGSEMIHVFCILPNFVNYFTYSYGNQYNTQGLQISNHDLIPFGFGIEGSYATNFKQNQSYLYSLSKSFRLYKSRFVNVKGTVENQDFNTFQFHKYQLETKTSFELLKFKSKYYKYPKIRLILGFLNYDAAISERSFGYGLGLERDLFKGFHLEVSAVKWGDFNEFALNTNYNWFNSNWSSSLNYNHLGQYEEFKIGVSYVLPIYSKSNRDILKINN